MKKDQVKVGQVYAAKVSGKLVPVRIEAEGPRGGWKATNVQTNRPVFIRSPQRLRNAVATGQKAGGDTKGKKPEKAQRQNAAAQAQADQENARLRDEREASPDGHTASERAMAESADDAAANDAATGAAGASKASKGATRGEKRDTGERGEPSAKRPSGLDAAAAVLAEAGEPLSTKQMIERMLERGLWTTEGKTPANTLYAAILREIGKKGADSRFRKVDRGRFELAK